MTSSDRQALTIHKNVYMELLKVLFSCSGVHFDPSFLIYL